MVRNRKFATFTIEKNILKKFNIITRKLAINKSQLIEKLIIEWLEKNIEIQKKV